MVAVTIRHLCAAAACAVLAAVAHACGGSPTAPGDQPPVVTNTITITASGASPRNIQISQGQRVRFVNNDNRAHVMASDPHPDHSDCPEFDQVGFLSPGQSRETGNLVTIRTCGFHDHDDANNNSLKGSVIIR